MNYEYNQWYWRLYRWFKWDAKYFPERFITGVKNLYKWFPIIWKDRNYDHDYIFVILKFKLENQAKQFIKSGHTESAEREAELMMTCVRLIDKIQNEYYFEEIYHYETLTSEIVNQYMDKHNKAKRLLFKILNDKIETWWY